jgi:peptidoglycan-N-acetylglucosamine deacetylase
VPRLRGKLGRRFLAGGLVVALVVLALCGLRELARSRTVQVVGRIVPRVSISERVVALTFDDGPVPARVDEITAVLARRKVKATFFVEGGALERSPESGRRLVEAGHELGNHTFSHPHMVLKSPAFIRSEIERTDAAIRAAGHTGEIHFRPPFGYKLFALPWFLWRTGRTTVTWDIEPDSSREIARSPQSMAEHVVAKAGPGSIILLHVWYASRETSRGAVPLIVDGLQARGYQFVTVSELMRRGQAKLPPGGGAVPH